MEPKTENVTILFETNQLENILVQSPACNVALTLQTPFINVINFFLIETMTISKIIHSF